jgi:hypothetical protein
MQAYCRVCGKPLHDPISIARGMGPKCAGIPNAGRAFRSNQRQFSGSAYGFTVSTASIPNLISYVEDSERRLPDALRSFPSDLVDLVLSAPSNGSIAARIKLYQRQKSDSVGMHPVKMLKEIRRMCIEFRLLFWPGLSMNLEPLPCIPYGESDWKIGENGRVCSKDELVAYLSRYGIISAQS